jgi:hypothetical protein
MLQWQTDPVPTCIPPTSSLSQRIVSFELWLTFSISRPGMPSHQCRYHAAVGREKIGQTGVRTWDSLNPVRARQPLLHPASSWRNHQHKKHAPFTVKGASSFHVHTPRMSLATGSTWASSISYDANDEFYHFRASPSTQALSLRLYGLSTYGRLSLLLLLTEFGGTYGCESPGGI